MIVALVGPWVSSQWVDELLGKWSGVGWLVIGRSVVNGYNKIPKSIMPSEITLN